MTNAPGPPLATWFESQARASVAGLLRCISATHLVKHRPGFGQVIVPRRGSILASPGLGDYNPEPDYFFHWLRDSAVMLDAVGGLASANAPGADWLAIIEDVVRFGLELTHLDPADAVTPGGAFDRVQADMLRWTRDRADAAALTGDRILGDVRFNADGTLDIKDWARPQNDGPALRALTTLRLLDVVPAERAGLHGAMQELLVADLRFVAARAGEPCHDLWEEKSGRHYHTELVQAAALEAGAVWSRTLDLEAEADHWAAIAADLLAELDVSWRPEAGCYRPRRDVTPDDPADFTDAALILATVHTRRSGGRHSVLDDRIHASLMSLEAAFAPYAINLARPAGLGIAYGRYPGDRYYSGGAFYMTTFAAAELHYALATRLRQGQAMPVTATNAGFRAALATVGPTPAVAAVMAGEPRACSAALVSRGDSIMAMARRFIPPSGELAEQFDQTTGRPNSAMDLGWSYAAFLTAHSARAACVALEDFASSPRDC